MLGSYYQNEIRASGWKKSAIVLIGVVALVGIVGSIALSNKSGGHKHFSVLSAEMQEFEDFIYNFDKKYSSQEEHELRFKIFRDNLAYIRVFNSMGNTIVLGVNQFADMDFSEFKSKYLPFKHPRSHAYNTESFEGVTVPASVDWRTKGAVTGVKDQGQCGSCWAFSTTGAVEGAWFLAGHSLVSLSEQQLMDCSRTYGNLGCNGGLMDSAFKYIVANKGITSESNYPYTAKGGLCDRTKAAQVVAKITGYKDVTASSYTSLEAAVAQQPVSVAVEADQSSWQLYKSGVITTDCGTNLDHGVLVVGYDTTDSTPYWIVKNSWGTDWGLAGYIQIAITSGDGVCGINLEPSYPVV
jgi:Papain family cysteine protease/Cathepsin propeptide inhibitor domain (I29)